MPFIKLQLSKSRSNTQNELLLKAASKILASNTGKPEAYTMAMIDKADACMAGKVAPAAFVDIRGIGGFSRDINGKISKDICDLLEKEAGIAPDHVYITFTSVAAENWGWKGTTFG